MIEQIENFAVWMLDLAYQVTYLFKIVPSYHPAYSALPGDYVAGSPSSSPFWVSAAESDPLSHFFP